MQPTTIERQAQDLLAAPPIPQPYYQPRLMLLSESHSLVYFKNYIVYAATTANSSPTGLSPLPFLFSSSGKLCDT